MQAVLDSGEVVIGTRGIVHALHALHVPAVLIEFIEENLDESDMLERQANIAHDSDFGVYERENEAYIRAVRDVLEIVEKFSPSAPLNKKAIFLAFDEIRNIIKNVD